MGFFCVPGRGGAQQYFTPGLERSSSALFTVQIKSLFIPLLTFSVAPVSLRTRPQLLVCVHSKVTTQATAQTLKLIPK